jgi:hypothetical protein
MKKFLKILSITILVLIILLVTAPIIFKSKIIKIANEQLDKNLNAHAKFSDISISLIRNFPNLSISIKDLNVTGINEFEGDTLVDIRNFEIAVNLISAIKMKNIEVKKIIIDNPYINAIILKDGKANWDITKPSEETQPEDTTASESNTKIQLKLFKINDATIKYTDLEGDMSASLEKMNFTLTGDLSEDFTNMVIDSRTEKFNYIMDGIRYAKNILLLMHFDIDANLKESIYILKENQVSLNALTLKWDGSIEMPASGDIITKLSFATTNTDFKTVLSLVPAIYMKDYADLKTTGSLKLEGKVTGAVTETATPNVDAKLLISNATFSYPDLPQKAENIQIDVNMHYDGVQMDNTTVDVNKFHIDLGVNPIDMTMNLRTPISDPFTNGNISMSLDLGTLKDVVPLEDMELTGLITAKLDWMGKYSSIEKEQYEEFKADGEVQVLNLFYKSSDLPNEFILKKAQINFTPKQMVLSAFEAKMGNSDFALTGKVSNYIPYVLKDETIDGELSLISNVMDLNELMGPEDTLTTAAADTAPMELFEVPGNIDFRFSSAINKTYYDNLVIDNLKGLIIIKDHAVKMQNVSMNLLDGSILLSGEYNTLDLKNPFMNLDFTAKGIDIPKTADAFATVGKMAPVVKNATGKVTLDMTFNSFLNQDMTPVMNSINGTGKLLSDQIGIKKSPTFSKIGSALKTNAFDNMAFKNIDISFEIIKGSIYVDPFETKMGDAVMIISGKQSLDNTLDYSINMGMPRKMLGLNNDAVTNLYSGAAAKGLNITPSENVHILAKVTGPMNDPKVTLDLKENAKNAVKEVKDEIKKAATEAIETKKEEVKVKARAEADKILKDAEKQAQMIKDEGKKLADATRSEANSNADKLVKEAKNPIAKAAAKASADKIKSEGEKKAQSIEKEANNNADKVMKEARTKADNLLK